ncbi:MAG: hypothetical protein IJN11_01405 [Oscillospiraceae bacterium]|nr:hypothetical protein [Oscillospiraceae bacterium]
MNKEKLEAFRTWWAQCPCGSFRLILAIGLVLASVLMVYRCGEALGEFLYHVMH